MAVARMETATLTGTTTPTEAVLPQTPAKGHFQAQPNNQAGPKWSSWPGRLVTSTSREQQDCASMHRFKSCLQMKLPPYHNHLDYNMDSKAIHQCVVDSIL
uniref:Uncharacterized protein n=1 Tax=Oryza brachyantha TaxID=4533 RepID=J3MVY4_ORYBR